MKTIEMQLNSQAEIVYVFDTNAKQLTNNYFLNVYFVKLKENIFKRFPDKVAYFCKNNPLLNDPFSIKNNYLAGMVYGKSHGLEDHLKLNKKGFLQGNFNPEFLQLPFDDFKVEFDNFLNRFLLMPPKDRSGWICSLNHGVLPKSRESNVKYFIEKIRESFANKS